MEEHSCNRCNDKYYCDDERYPNGKRLVYNHMNCRRKNKKKAWIYRTGYDVETPCIGGSGSKPAFNLLRDNPNVKVKRDYSCYVGHTAFQVYAKTLKDMQKAKAILHLEYHWIDRYNSDGSEDLSWTEHCPTGYHI